MELLNIEWIRKELCSRHIKCRMTTKQCLRLAPPTFQPIGMHSLMMRTNRETEDSFGKIHFLMNDHVTFSKPGAGCSSVFV